jgi:hypothetical protein
LPSLVQQPKSACSFIGENVTTFRRERSVRIPSIRANPDSAVSGIS